MKTMLVYSIIRIVTSYYAHNFMTRPITVVPILGLVLGDLQTGLILGAELELIYMGITTVGGSIPSDVFLGGTLTCAFVIGAGVPLEGALALAVAIGVVAALFTLAVRLFLVGAYIPFFEKYAAQGNDKAFFRLGIWGHFISHLPFAVLVYVAVYLGADAVTAFMNSLPEFITLGLSVAAGMMPAVGIAMLANMLWSTKMSIYFIFGFAVTVYLKISMVGLIFIAAFITLVVVYQQMDLRNGLKSVRGSAGEEDDLFG
jgi:mannose/fructose/N-acetylgalactosamine-specific phosphotransferase system component IIC